MSKAIHEKHLRLLIHCDVVKEYEILQDVMYNHPNITKDKLKDISFNHFKFFETMYPKILKHCFTEWTANPETDIKVHLKSEHIKCDMCSHELEYVCNIHHKYNGKSLKIGRECNKHFEIYKDVDIDKFIEKNKQLKRTEKLDDAVPFIEEKIKVWDNFIRKESIYVFFKIKGRYEEIKYELVKLHSEYIDSKTITINRENSIIKVINKLLIEAENEKNKIKIFIDKSRGNILIPSNDMVNTMKRFDKSRIGEKWLEEDTVIKARTLHRFRNDEFSCEIIPIFNEVLQLKNINIIKLKRLNNEVGYNVILNENKDATLFYSYFDLCNMCGMYVTKQMSLRESVDQFDYDSFFKSSKLIDEYSIEYGLGLMENLLKNNLIKIKEFYHSYNEVYWKVLKSEESDKPKFYYSTKIDNVREILKNLLYKKVQYKESEMYNLLKKNSIELGISTAESTMRARDTSYRSVAYN